MLRDINNHRPDIKLERSLVFLSYAIMFMSLSLFAWFIYPQYSLYIIAWIVLWNVICILITIHILKVSENAIGFGTMASEILNDKTKYYRIDNSLNEPIIINKAAKEYFQGLPILKFLEQNIIDSPANKMDLQKLISAVNKLHEVSVTLSINPKQNSIFVAEEWLKVSVKPIYLNKTDIFEDDFSFKKIRKESYIFWTVENITAYKNMDQIFQSELSALHNFLDYLPVGLYTCDATGKIEYINNLLADKLETNKNDAIGRTLDDFIAYKKEALHSINGEYDDNLVFKTKDGNTEAYVRQQNIRENNELKSRGVVIWNIPNDEQLRQRLNVYISKFTNVMNTAPWGIVFVDEYLNITSCNAYAMDIFATEKEKLIGKRVGSFFDNEISEKFKSFLNSKSKEILTFETLFKNEQAEKNLRVTIYKNDFYGADVNESYIIYLQDTTNRRSLEMQVAQAQKMQAFGQLAGGVAHDFNNLLTAVVGYCDLLLRRHGIGDPSFADLIELKNNVTRAIGVARQLLAMSRKQPLNPKLIEVTEALADNEHLIARVIGEKVKLQVNYDTDLGYIRVDTVQLSQVLLNLAINARDAMEGTGSLTINVRIERLSSPYQFGTDIINPGDFAVISVSDTGCGISSENLGRIFEPFYSTKKNVSNSGTGLGLSMVYSIVRQMEGFIKVYSELGKGTTFEIYLPSYENPESAERVVELDETAKNSEAKNEQTGVPYYADENSQKIILGLNITEFDSQRSVARTSGEIKILFVDDEYAVRVVGARGLRQKGYDVTDCVSAENALEHIEQGEQFDLLITDMVMPGMSGAELANIMRQKNPQTLIILASGYSEEIARKELASSADFHFISKPYGLDDLNKKVKEVLDIR